MKYYAENQSEITVEGGTVAEVVDALIARYPSLRFHMLDSDGKLRRHFNIFVNGEHIRDLNGMDTLLKDDDKIILLASAAGG